MEAIQEIEKFLKLFWDTLHTHMGEEHKHLSFSQALIIGRFSVSGVLSVGEMSSFYERTNVSYNLKNDRSEISITENSVKKIEEKPCMD